MGRIDRIVKIGETQLNIPDLENEVLSHKFVENCHVDFEGGALRALVWAAPKAPGMYNMRHVLGFE